MSPDARFALCLLIVVLVGVDSVSAQESRAASRVVADTPSVRAARAAVNRAQGGTPNDRASALCDLALTLRAAGRVRDAIEPARNGVEVVEQNPNSTRASLAQVRKVLAVVLYDSDRSVDALPVARAAALDAVAGWGDEDPRTIQAYFILGGVAKSAGEFEEAETALRRALRDEELTAPILRVQFLQGLGEVIAHRGRFAEARVCFSEATDLIASIEDVPPAVRAYHESAVGLFENALGRFADARGHFERQLEIVRGMTPVPQAELGLALQNLARAAVGEGRAVEARRLQDEGLAAFSRAPKDARVGELLADAARTARGLGDFERSAVFADRLLVLLREYGDNPILRTRALQAAAAAKHGLGRPEEALPLFDEALECARRAYADFHQHEVVALAGKGQALWALGRTRDARACLRSAANAAVDTLVGHSASLSETERLSYLLSARGAFDLWLSSAVDDPSEAAAVAAEALSWKGLVLRAMQTERSALRAREGPETGALRAELARVQNSLASIVRIPSASRPSVDRLIEEREKIERGLAVLVMGVAGRLITPTQVSATLEEDEALVDYVTYRRSDPADARVRTSTDERLLAIVYRQGREPRVIQVGAVAVARDAIEAHLRITARDVQPDPVAEPLARAMAVAARDAVWSPIMPAIEGARRVFIVPDGFLAALPFETLPAADGLRLVLEDLEITYLLGVQDRLEPPDRRTGVGALLVGDVDYGEVTSPESRESARGGILGLSLPRLPQTKGEIDAIALALSGAAVPPEQVLRIVGREATESRVKAGMPGKRIVHLASHGVFLRDAAEKEATSFRVPSALAGALPSLRSGVALAGINASGGGGDDGLLTAAEVAWCDLSGCDLAVISSCESGLGVPRAGESMLGLRRSLRLAGACSTVTALWRVDDAAAAELMRAFYEGLLVKKLPKAAALREAKLQALQAARKAGAGRGNPGTWGAFVLDGGWK